MIRAYNVMCRRANEGVETYKNLWTSVIRHTTNNLNNAIKKRWHTTTTTTSTLSVHHCVSLPLRGCMRWGLFPPMGGIILLKSLLLSLIPAIPPSVVQTLHRGIRPIQKTYQAPYTHAPKNNISYFQPSLWLNWDRTWFRRPNSEHIRIIC